MHHQQPVVLIEDHVFDDRAFDAQQPLPYPCKTHAVP
jgi:hypothetical protein